MSSEYFSVSSLLVPGLISSLSKILQNLMVPHYTNRVVWDSRAAEPNLWIDRERLQQRTDLWCARRDKEWALRRSARPDLWGIFREAQKFWWYSQRLAARERRKSFHRRFQMDLKWENQLKLQKKNLLKWIRESHSSLEVTSQRACPCFIPSASRSKYVALQLKTL